MAIRLDFMGGLMVFVVAMLAVSHVSGIDPAQVGLVLTYTSECRLNPTAKFALNQVS